MPGEFYIKGKTEKANIKGLEDRLDSPVFGLAVLKTLIDAANGRLDDGTSGLAALKALLDAMKDELEDPGSGLTGLLAEINANEVKIDIIDALVDVIKTQTDKLAGAATVTGSVTQNWQAAEQDMVTIGANGVSYKLHMGLIDISALAGNISIRAYHQINGAERRIFPVPANTTFTAAASAPGIPLIDTSGVITEALRVTVQSDNAADNGQPVGYEYKLEAM